MKKEVQNTKFRSITWLFGIIFFGSMLVYGGIQNKEKIGDKWDSIFPEKELEPVAQNHVSNFSGGMDSLLLADQLVSIISTIILISFLLMMVGVVFTSFSRVGVGDL